jgi:peptidoglycan/xylan/chitin deacetylase (PgdA/CDA1 family)
MLLPHLTHAAWRPIVPGKTHSSSSVSSASSAPSHTSQTSVSLPILTYHYVESAKGATKRGAALTIIPTVFERQLQAIQERKYRSVFIREIPSSLLQTSEEKLIALTFDDGYEDFYVNVLPLLKKYHMNATLYIITDFIGKPGYVTAEELKQIIASGLVEIGAHTVHHKNLRSISLKRAQDEIETSKRTLEQNFGITVQSFAYPFGKHSPKIDALVQQAGFTAAVTTERGYVQNPQQLFDLKRVPAGAFVGSRKWRAIGMTP